MKVHSINNNYGNPNFGTRYTVKGNKDEVRQVFDMVKKNIKVKPYWNLMLHYNPDILLICTDYESRTANWKLQKNFDEDPFRLYPEFLKNPLDIQLQEIFEEGAKDVKQYDASEILCNPDFDFKKGE